MGLPQPDTGSVTEDVGVTGGLITATGDADFGPWFNNDAGQWTAQTITGAYGSQLVIDSNGVWTYTATNSNAAIQALDSGDTLTEVFTISSTQGNTTITITINGTDDPPCFVAGTLIDTPHGPRPVEDLRAGDEVLTRDDGVQRLRWAGQRRLILQDDPAAERCRPIRLRAGCLGNGLPRHDLVLSPMHRVLIRAPQVQLLTGEDEILCPLRLLVNGRTITHEACASVSYHHLLFDRHQVIMSHGCETESFFPGEIGLNGFDAGTRDEIFSLFPELRSMPGSYGALARGEARGFEAALLASALPSA